MTLLTIGAVRPSAYRLTAATGYPQTKYKLLISLRNLQMNQINRNAAIEELERRLALCEHRVAPALEVLGIPKEWNYLVITDGSGSKWSEPCGWGALLVSKETGQTNIFKGGMDHGTVNVAELLGCLNPLLWLVNQPEFVLEQNNVHVCTDSEMLYNGGSRRHQRNANTELWAMLDVLERKGLQITFHWVPRGVWAPNIAADALAGQGRLAIAALD
jgi:ribonuclease HI